VTVDDVTLTWAINDESGGGAYFGGCNFLSAGTAGNTGSSRVWAEADGFYSATEDNVSIEKPTAAGGWEAPTWSTKCQNAAGSAVDTAVGSTTGNRIKLVGGSGLVDVAAGTATIEWEGSFTVVYYGGLTYWTATDPVLTIEADGSGSLTATGSGWGADMNDSTKWVELTPQTITLANLTDVTLSDTGFTISPDYLGVEVTAHSTQQVRTGENWGSFPQDFIDFQTLTGQSSYWYSSGGAADPKKLAKPITIEWDASVPAPEPKVEVSAVTLSADGVNTITISGTGFDPAAVTGLYGPVAGKSSGVYVAFGKFADVWKPSDGATSAARPAAVVRWALLEELVASVGGESAGAIVLSADGSFTVTLEVSAAAADDAAAAKGLSTGNYGIYTYPGGGASQPAFETYTPVDFVPGIPIVVSVPEGTTPPTGEFSWRIAGNAAVSLGTATETVSGFSASGALPNIEVTDTRPTAAEWSLSGTVSDFVGLAGTFSGSGLGWTPVVANAGAGAEAGTAVLPGVSGGLSTAKTLAYAPSGHVLGTATMAAALELEIPAGTAAGSYTGVLTITAVG
jgi:hypothetical protein